MRPTFLGGGPKDELQTPLSKEMSFLGCILHSQKDFSRPASNLSELENEEMDGTARKQLHSLWKRREELQILESSSFLFSLHFSFKRFLPFESDERANRKLRNFFTVSGTLHFLKRSTDFRTMAKDSPLTKTNCSESECEGQLAVKLTGQQTLLFRSAL